MKPTAIVYTSNTGNTARYAQMLAEKLHLPIYSVEEAKKTLPKHTSVIYLGWLMAGRIKDLGKAKRRYQLTAVGAVGLGAAGGLSERIRKSNSLPEKIPIFELRGGMDHAKLTGLYKKMIDTLVNMLSRKKDRTDEETAMLEAVIAGGDFVREENLEGLTEWFRDLR